MGIVISNVMEISFVLLDVADPWLNAKMVRACLICKLDHKMFYSDCPCGKNCPLGCNECSNPICKCGSNDNQDYINCKKDKSVILEQCIIACVGMLDCKKSCIEEFKTQHDTCPCQV